MRWIQTDIIFTVISLVDCQGGDESFCIAVDAMLSLQCVAIKSVRYYIVCNSSVSYPYRFIAHFPLLLTCLCCAISVVDFVLRFMLDNLFSSI